MIATQFINKKEKVRNSFFPGPSRGGLARCMLSPQSAGALGWAMIALASTVCTDCVMFQECTGPDQCTGVVAAKRALPLPGW